VEALRTTGAVSVLLGMALTLCGADIVAGPATQTPSQTVAAGTVPAAGGPNPPTTVPDGGSPPVALEIPALGVRARVRPAGVRADGALEVPPSARDLGWWRDGARPGSRQGTVVVAGHVDTAEEGPGALFSLARLPLGSQVRVRSADGRTRVYRIAARRVHPKGRLPASVFTPLGPPRLALITCTGEFDHRSASYSHNLVAYATGG
jgi:hypothetical protein